ncbi:hypothetical protein ANAPC5_01099 [Anaplasma phagocytophilum]|nr:hypothetical protein ANAPC2_01170 [Anaplasma phagocytophilum]SBO32889.1 hypothetical protein ANAPC3_01026 [Anaplasma phagocytophilum]SBO33534.1 hypothetical protein ANAPC4_01192 [Anaplasma phagocytophilum]SCV65264.1 hypothetical protein ANAPC5_01099 [Anaplasma phagocytophilum]
MEISHSEIDKKVCRTKSTTAASGKYGSYADTTDNTANSTKVALCGGEPNGNGSAGGANTNVEFLRNFVEKTLLGNGSKNWPTSTGTANGKPAPVTNDNAEAVAGDLTKLNPEEKTIVAGLLAKTIEGGEVVEIRAVSSTFSMVNLGYRNWGFIVTDAAQ